jgi:hypothetical protein
VTTTTTLFLLVLILAADQAPPATASRRLSARLPPARQAVLLLLRPSCCKGDYCQECLVDSFGSCVGHALVFCLNPSSLVACIAEKIIVNKRD